MSFTEWSLFVGVLLVCMMLAGTLLGRLPLSSAMVYLGVGWLLGPQVLNVLLPDPYLHTALLEHLAEVALLISLFVVGLQLGVPLRDLRWRLPLRLATLSMVAMVAMVAVVAMYGLGLSLGPALLLGAILSPTDPVLASGVPAEPSKHPDPLGFSLAAEGGLNDGAAFPLVVLGLGLMGLYDLGEHLWRWWALDVLWGTLAGCAIGWGLGTGVGRLVLHLRSRRHEAVGLDEFLGLGIIGMAFGVAQLSHASGYLAVFAAGLALRRARTKPVEDAAPLPTTARVEGHTYDTLATHPAHASSTMRETVQGFNEQLESLAEMALVLVVGAMLAYTRPLPAVWWFVPLLLLVLRPLSAALSMWGEGLTTPQRVMISWFGVRGIGSVFYLLFALRHGLDRPLAELLVSLTLWTVAASIVAHGLSAQPMMQRYILWRRREKHLHKG